MNHKETAIKYYESGLSVIPIGENKIPIGSWIGSQSERKQPNGTFTSCTGIGVVCGLVSGNLFCLDFDTKHDKKESNSWIKWKSLLSTELRDLVLTCYVEETPTGGKHIIYRVDSEVPGNIKLAARFASTEELLNSKNKSYCFIESRGNGGYVQVAPTEGYKVLNGDITKLTTLTKEQHESLLDVCKKMDLTDMWKPVVVEKPLAQKPKRLGVGVFDDYNMRADVPQLLEDSGWTYVETQGGNMRYRRPGTTDSRTSADWHSEKRLFYVFTSSTEFDMNRGYNAVQMFTMISFGALNRDSYALAAKEMRALGYGEQDVVQDEIEKQIELEKTNHYLADDEEIDKFLEDVRNDNVVMGVGAGLDDLDHNWLYKPASFNMIGGMSNVGKTDWLMWWFSCLSRKHGFKWLVCSTENEAGELFKMIIEYSTAMQLKDMTNAQYKEALAWAKEHFTMFTNKRTYTYQDVLDSAKLELMKDAYAGLIIDPQSSLELDVKELKLYGEYRYHYRSATQFRLFTKQTGCSIYLVAHPNTEANKRLKDGYAQAPYAADIEFGSMWQNRCDNSITVHRVINHPTEWMVTEIHVRKIKSTFTGGSITSEPVRLRREWGCCFVDTQGRTPIAHNKMLKPYGTKEEEEPYKPSDIAPF